MRANPTPGRKRAKIPGAAGRRSLTVGRPGVVRAILDEIRARPASFGSLRGVWSYRILRRLLARQNELRILVQEVFLNLFRKLPTCALPGHCPPSGHHDDPHLAPRTASRWVRPLHAPGAKEDIDPDLGRCIPIRKARQAGGSPLRHSGSDRT